jgi:hypothetical protein
MSNPLYKTQISGDLRMECLKLAARPGLGPTEVTAVADVYLGWVIDRATFSGSGPSDEYRASSMSPEDSRKDGETAPVMRTSQPKKNP